MTSASPSVRLAFDGPVATVTLCRPDARNAQTPELWDALRETGRQLTGDVRVVVVRGDGPAFSAGLDRDVLAGDLPAQLAAQPPEQAEQRLAEFQEAFSWLRRADLVTVAAVHGHAVGAGFQLALACDLRVLADDARFAMTEVTHGLVPDLGGTGRLVELVGYGRALELCLTGRQVDAAEASRLGLAELVVPAGELSGAVDDLTAAVLAADRTAAAEIKTLLGAAAGRSYPGQARAERQAQLRRLRDLTGAGE